MKALIVDDEAVSLLVLSKVVRALGHEVEQAHDAETALKMFRAEPVQVVLTDWQMPGMSGPELCKKIRAMRRPRYAYIVLVTARSDRESYIAGLDAGADDFITKPVDADELGARLRVAERILALQDEMSQLRGLLAICSYCKKIREGESWVPVERYVGRRTDTSFSHGICPNCFQTHFGDEEAP